MQSHLELLVWQVEARLPLPVRIEELHRYPPDNGMFLQFFRQGTEFAPVDPVHREMSHDPCSFPGRLLDELLRRGKVFADPIVRTAPQAIVRFFQSVDADPDRIRRDIQGKRAVRGDRDPEKMPPRVLDDFAQAPIPVLPEKRFSPFEDDDPRAEPPEVVQGLYGAVPGQAGSLFGRPPVKGAGLA